LSKVGDNALAKSSLVNKVCAIDEVKRQAWELLTERKTERNSRKEDSSM
jgi:hypothetical protein